MPDMFLDVDAALAGVPVNLMPLIDDTDFKTVEDAVAYNASGMDLRFNFVNSAGTYTSTAVTPTTSGAYDWTHQGDGMYSIEIPASGGASINNDTEGYGWFSGRITGVLPFRGPVICFRAAGLNDLLCDSAYSTTRGLAGTALPAAAADAAGGLPISDAGGLDIDTLLGRITGNVALASVLGALNDAAVDGDPTTSDTVMQYIKQLINTLVGAAGIPTYPSSAAPGNAVSLAEAIRQIYDEVAGIDGAAIPSAATVAGAVWDVDATGHQTQGTFGQAIGDPAADTDSIWSLANTNLPILSDGTFGNSALNTDLDTLLSRMGTPSNLGGGATLSGNLSDIESQTDDIGALGAGLTAIPDSAGVGTLLTRIPSGLFTGITSLAQWLGLIAGKQVGNTTARTELRATGAGSGTFDETTDSEEAISDAVSTLAPGTPLALTSEVTEATFNDD